MKPRKEFFSWNTFLSVGFIEGSEKLSFFLRREFDNGFVSSCEDRYGRTLREREAFDDNLAADYGA